MTSINTGYLTQKVMKEGSEDEEHTWRDREEGQPTYGNQLTTSQKKELDTLLDEFRGVMSTIPGQTRLVEHQIDTVDVRPIQLPPYCLQDI